MFTIASVPLGTQLFYLRDCTKASPETIYVTLEPSAQRELTPRLWRFSSPGVTASFTIISDRLFNDTSCPLKGSPFCVTWYATASPRANQPGRRIVLVEIGAFHRVRSRARRAASRLPARRLRGGGGREK
jgi:hypothetical protein